MTEDAQYSDPGEPPVLDWIDKGLIDIDSAHQRGLDEGGVQKVKAFASVWLKKCQKKRKGS